MKNLLTTVASAAFLLASTSAFAGNYENQQRSGDDTRHNAGQYSAIQKGQSASTKQYGYNKQGDHYSTRNAHRDQWENSYGKMYPGQSAAYGAKSGVVIRKGGSGISDSSAEASSRQYGTYWN